MDDEDERKNLIEALQNDEGNVKGFAMPKDIGEGFIELIQSIESKMKAVESVEPENKDKMFGLVRLALQAAFAMFELQYHVTPFIHMHKGQAYPEYFDDKAKRICALMTADMQTIQTLLGGTVDTLNDLRKHLDPVFKKLKADERRKESMTAVTPSTEGEAEAPRKVIDFAERRGQLRPQKATLH